MQDSWARPSPTRLCILVVSALLAGLGLSFALVGSLGANEGACGTRPTQTLATCPTPATPVAP